MRDNILKNTTGGIVMIVRTLRESVNLGGITS